jgi:hypothetical protein
MRTPSQLCRNGHEMAGDNLLWHKRYDATGNQFLVRECRTCANQRYRTKRSAARRNRDLEVQALIQAMIREEDFVENNLPVQSAGSQSLLGQS